MSRPRLEVAFMRPVDGGLLLDCVECSAELRVVLPADVNELIGVTRDFTRRHAPCLRRALVRAAREKAAS